MTTSSTTRLTKVINFENSDDWVKTVQVMFNSVKNRAGLTEKIKWALNTPQGSPEEACGVEDLVDDLTSFFTASDRLDVATAVLGTILPSNNQELIRTMSSRGVSSTTHDPNQVNTHDEDTIEEDAIEDEEMSALAWIKEEILVMSEQVSSLAPGTITPCSRLRGLKHDSTNNRATGQYQGEDVFIEWKTIPSTKRNAVAPILEKRIRDIAYLLRSDRKPLQFRIPDCVGLVRDIKSDRTTFGLVFEMKSATLFSLGELLKAKGRKMALGDRFAAARTLAKAVLYLLLASWLHKAIRSDNAVYFASNVDGVDFEWPFLVGFDMSRLNKENEMTEIPEGELRFNLYRHPRVPGFPVDVEVDEKKKGSRDRISALHGINNFGVILIELAGARDIENLLREEYPECFEGGFSAERMRSWLIE